MKTIDEFTSAVKALVGNTKSRFESRRRGRLGAIAEKRLSLYTLWAPKPAVAAAVRTGMTELARVGREAHGPVMLAAASGRIETFPGRADALIDPALPPMIAAGAPVSWDQLAWVLEEMLGEKQVSDGWTRFVQRSEYVAGDPMSDGLPALARLAAEETEIRREDAAEVDELAAAGLTMPHLPEEAARRIQAGQQAERDAVHERLNAGMRRREAQRRGERPA